jgi:cephalosporin-C deacetylase-like acetyl esterase
MIMSLNKNIFLAGFMSVTLTIRAQELTVAPDKASGVYEIGQMVHWLATWSSNSPTPEVQFRLLSGGLTEATHGYLAFSNHLATLDTKLESPGTMLLELKAGNNDSHLRVTAGIVVAPKQIMVSAPQPADFEAFWQAKLIELEKIPVNSKLESVDVGNANLSYWKISMDNIRGTHIHGQLARPAQGKKFPALLILQYAGVYGLKTSWVTDRAKDGWLALNIEAHDLPIDRTESFYQEQRNGALREYQSIGNDDRDTSYFLRMYLSCFRALQYLTQREDWDGKTLVVMGDSQGGMQALMLAGLHPQQITAVNALLPAGCDLNGPDIGRAGGWPNWYFSTGGGKDPEKVHQASRYYDVANFTPSIRCPVLVGVGLRDETCPPAGVIAAFNKITSPKEIIILPKSAHFGTPHEDPNALAAFNGRRWKVWMPTLIRGEPAPVQN